MLFRNTKLLFGTLMAAALAFGGAQAAIAQDVEDTGTPSQTPFEEEMIPGDEEGRVYSEPGTEATDTTTVPTETPFEEEMIPGSEEGRDYSSEETVDTADGEATTVPTETPFEEEIIPGDEEGREFE